MATFRRGDIVASYNLAGVVLRAAKDQSWVDVRWGGWSKRQRKPSILTPTGYTIRDALRWLDNWSLHLTSQG